MVETIKEEIKILKERKLKLKRAFRKYGHKYNLNTSTEIRNINSTIKLLNELLINILAD